jgi:hypothetical protein
MTTPNIVAVKSILGGTAVQSVGTSLTAIVSNASGSNTIIKVDSLIISNNDTAGHTVTVDLYRGSSYPISKNVSIAPGAAYDVLAKYIYLVEGDSLRISADAGSMCTAVASYVTIKETV